MQKFMKKMLQRNFQAKLGKAALRNTNESNYCTQQPNSAPNYSAAKIRQPVNKTSKLKATKSYYEGRNYKNYQKI